MGTGVFGAEYLVASKQIGNTDMTLGVGWGRLAGEGLITNPLRQIDDRFTVRSAETGLGGEFSLGDFFSGPEVGIFGGVSHAFEGLPLTAMFEYYPDQYDWDAELGGEQPDSPWSVGLTWHALPGVDLRLTLQHGSKSVLVFAVGIWGRTTEA